MFSTTHQAIADRLNKLSSNGDPLARLNQKDIDARWTKKNHQNYYGYKNHVAIDAKHKIIRKYQITSANVSDINCFDTLLDDNNPDKKVWADCAYYSNQKEQLLKEKGYESRIGPVYNSDQRYG